MSDTRDISESRKHKGGIIIPALCRIVGILLIVLVLAFGAALVIPKSLGYGTYNIMSGSMEPEIPTGSIIYVKPVDPLEIGEGDIIVYNRTIEGEYDLEGFIVAHRVIDIDLFAGEFTTKGDANEAEDMNPVKFSEVLGIVAFHLPMLGQFMTIYTTVPGKICLIGVALCGVLLNVLAGRIVDRRAERNKDEG